MKRTLLLSLSLLACVAAASAPAPGPKVEDIVASYTKLSRLTKDEAHPVTTQLLDLCGTYNVKSEDEETKKRGDHAFTNIHVYMDQSGREAFQKGAEYPVGAVIVKEKNPNRLAYRQTVSPRPVALGGMIKRKASSPSTVDNWEFFYVDGKKALASEKDLQRCKDCHTNAAKKDFVFGDWAGPAKK